MKNIRLTADRQHYSQSICDLRLAPNLEGLTKKEAQIAKKIYKNIPQYRSATKKLAQGLIYTRFAPQTHTHKDLNKNSGAGYVWKNNKLITIFHNTTWHRAKKAVRAYPDFVAGKIAPDIWQNYITNGHNTKRGLYANYTENKLERMNTIANSHADCLEEGKIGHLIRVSMRN